MPIENCANCDAPVLKVHHMIHRDGPALGPNLPLCEFCGRAGGPTCKQIWQKLAARAYAEQHGKANARIDQMLAEGNDAWFSDDNVYRYCLSRRLDASAQTSIFDPSPEDARREEDVQKVLVFVMLNPSKAGKKEPDPTSTRCVDFGNRWRFSRLLVVNMYGLVTPHPKELAAHRDPTGPLNDVVIRCAVERASMVVCAWGQRPPGLDLPSRVKHVYGLLPRDLYCIDVNDDGSPSHPLYLKSTLRPCLYLANNLTRVSTT